ncbi:MAG: GIY-YIG nuclease family protein [Atribacterota bacterium]|nr:GIY-YIG nuclease family protein [Atribacterota bacterium]
MKVEHNLADSVLKNADGSTYLLLIHVVHREHLLIGKLGWVNFTQGYYIYVGSAKRSIQKRLLRHLKGQKKKFWHIDYLLNSLPSARIANIWINREPCECTISQEILQSGIGIVIKKGFGSSDCCCLTHLFRIDNANLDIFKQLMTKNNFYPLSE